MSHFHLLSLCRSEDPMIHLNYAILLHNHGERQAAAKQFSKFESKLQKHKPLNPDPEVGTRPPSPCLSGLKGRFTLQVQSVSGRLGPVLQMGEELAEGRLTREEDSGQTRRYTWASFELPPQREGKRRRRNVQRSEGGSWEEGDGGESDGSSSGYEEPADSLRSASETIFS